MIQDTYFFIPSYKKINLFSPEHETETEVCLFRHLRVFRNNKTKNIWYLIAKLSHFIQGSFEYH